MTLLLDLILALLAIETAFLLATSRARLLPNLAAGAALMLALRLALSAAAPPYLLACLLAAGLAHLIDLRNRWHTGA